jgi:hypothetical protein
MGSSGVAITAKARGRALRAALASGAALIALAAACLVLASPAHSFRCGFCGSPAMGRCVHVVYRGAYGGSRCTTLSSTRDSRYEWLEGAGERPGFSATATEASLQTADGTRIVCGASELRGEWKGRNNAPDRREPEAAVSLLLDLCRNASSGAACETSGTSPGQITTGHPLDGELGYISGSPAGGEEPITIGLVLSPEEESSSTSVLSFTCGGPPELGGEAWTLQGAVIGRLGPHDVMSSTYGFTFKARGAEQVPQHFVGIGPQTLTARRVTETQTSEEAVGLTLRGEHRTIVGYGEEPLEFKAKGF